MNRQADAPGPLSEKYPLGVLTRILLARSDWHPFPTIDERPAWAALPESVRQSYVARGQEVAGQEWPLLLAIRYLDFARNGNRRRYEDKYFGRRSMLGSLVLAECVENEGRFFDEIGNGIWLICDEATWCVPAHVGVQRAGVGLPDTTEPIVDLFAAETAALLAWTDYLLGERLEQVSPQIRPRLYREVEARILTPLLARDDFGWMGFQGQRVNNWNPWINSNWLTAALLLERDPERRLAGVHKSIRSLDNFVGPYPRDGGCDEGPGYWGRAGASLLDCLELLHSATDGQFDVYDDPLIQEIGRFIYRVQIDQTYFVNFADASAVVSPSAGVVFRYGQRIGDPDMMALGSWLAADQDLLHPGVDRTGGLGRALAATFALPEITAVEPRQPLPRDVWLPEIQVMAARDQGGSSAGLYVAAKGGHNAESHNHNDVGSFVVYVDGRPLIVDAGVETYTRKTFSAERYTIWTMQSGYHNLLPTIDGVMQAPGRSFAARDVRYAADDKDERFASSKAARFSLDIAAAYPSEANLARWARTIVLQRGQHVEVTDSYELSAPAGAGAEIVLSLLTPSLADARTPGQIGLTPAPLPGERQSGAGRVTYDQTKFSVQVQEIAIDDARLGQVWGSRLTRLVFTAKDPPQSGAWRFTIAP